LGWEPRVGFVELINTMVDADIARWQRTDASATSGVF
jgi:GDP-D-mannose dehydratase